MEIQSLSIVVPTKNRCVNNCKFCVSRTHTNEYSDKLSNCLKKNSDSIEYKDFYNRLQYSRDNGCNVVILTGTGEPTQNFKFLKFFFEVNSKLRKPFVNIEIQTTGVLLNEDKLNMLRKLGVTTISLSISNIFNNLINLDIIQCKQRNKFDLFEIIKLIKKCDFNLRFSLNLINYYDNYTVDDVLKRCKDLGADQVTFRKLYKSKNNTNIDIWIENNKSITFYNKIKQYIIEKGEYLGKLPFGALQYNIFDMSVVVDSDCMNEEIKDGVFKFFILRENCRLYSKWDTKASLVF